MKATIRRARTETGDIAPGWIATKPSYGFAPAGAHHVTRHATFTAAVDALKPRTASAFAEFDRAGWTREDPHWIHA